MRLKIRLAVLAAAGIIAAPGFAAHAQDSAPSDPATPERVYRRPIHPENRIAEDLGLSDAQRQQLRQFREQHEAQARAIRNDAALSPDQRREKMQALRQQHEDFLQSILTPGQKAKWEQIQAQRRQRPSDASGQKNSENPAPQG